MPTRSTAFHHPASWLTWLAIAALFWSYLTSCTTTRPQPAIDRAGGAATLDSTRKRAAVLMVDSISPDPFSNGEGVPAPVPELVKNTSPFDKPADKPTFWQRVFGPGKAKCKGCTIINQYGTGNTAGVVDKKATASVGQKNAAVGPSEGSTNAPVAGDSNAAITAGASALLESIKGNGNSQKAEKHDTTESAPGIGATIAAKLAGPLGVVLAFAVVVAGIWLVVRWRERKQKSDYLA